jgi:hypothetical protein
VPSTPNINKSIAIDIEKHKSFGKVPNYIEKFKSEMKMT